jgi:hypothetical protein
MTTAQLVLLLTVAGGALWVLHKLGRWLTQLLEALAAVAVVFVTVWLVVKGVWTLGRWIVRHWRTSTTAAVVLAWCHFLGWPSLLVTAAMIASGCSGGDGGITTRSNHGSAATCAPGGCAGRSTPARCPAGCGPAA